MIALVVILPLAIGAATGLLAGITLKKERNSSETLIILILNILFTSGVGFVFNNIVMPKPVLNFMLIGMAFSATFSNMVTEKRLEEIMGAGLFTVIYIIARALGKYFGAYFGASITKSPKTVKKFLGFTLLPHSGVSLVFTGIAVSVLRKPAPECAQIIQGTIAAAAVINEIIAVIMAKKGFEWAGEFESSAAIAGVSEENVNPTIITISRQHGSGGREVGRELSKRLGIPFYDHELIEMAAESCPIDKSFFENADAKGAGGFWYESGESVNLDLSLSDKAFLHQASVIRELAKKADVLL